MTKESSKNEAHDNEFCAMLKNMSSSTYCYNCFAALAVTCPGEPKLPAGRHN